MKIPNNYFFFSNKLLDFPEESEDEEEIVEDESEENELKNLQQFEGTCKILYKIIYKLLCQFLSRTNKTYILLQKFLISLLANQKSLKTMQWKR